MESTSSLRLSAELGKILRDFEIDEFDIVDPMILEYHASTCTD